MATNGKEEDGRIRIRCKECGKRLKVPAGHPGKVFRCPICASTVIAPLSPAQVSEAMADHERVASHIIRATGWIPQLAQQTRYKSLESLAHSVGREYLDLVQSCASVLGRTPLKDHEAADRIQTLWREKSQKLREFAVKLMFDLDREIREIELSPLRKQPSFMERLDAKVRERRDLALVMKLIFNVTMPDGPSSQAAPPNPPPPHGTPKTQ
jgi:ribosomal protein S27E